MTNPLIYTVGHSNRPIDEFLRLLTAHGVKTVADVRLVPASRYNPQFGQAFLAKSLAQAGIGYQRIRALGGRRRASKTSKNLGWKNVSFRGYADYMATPEFAAGLAALKHMARERPTAVMCAEALPWRCHRSLIADALIFDGWDERDLMTETSAPRHKRTPFLQVQNGVLTYPRENDTASLF